ncbi:hypothetical protein D3C72_1826350 [compost metagenome]
MVGVAVLGGDALLVTLDHGGGIDVALVVRVVRIDVAAQGQGVADGDALVQARLVGLKAVTGG